MSKTTFSWRKMFPKSKFRTCVHYERKSSISSDILIFYCYFCAQVDILYVRGFAALKPDLSSASSDSLPAEVGDALARHFLEETAECGEVFKAQNLANLLSTLVGIDKQALGLRLHPFVDDAQRRGQFVSGKEVGQRLGRTEQHVGIILHTFLLLVIIVHQHMKLAHYVESLLTILVHRIKLAGNAGAGDDKPLEQNAKHLLLMAVVDFGLGNKLIDGGAQLARLFGGELQRHHVAGTMKEETAARHLVIMTEDAIEITVEQDRQIFSVYSIDIQMMQGGERHNLIGMQFHLYMIYLYGYFATAHPEKLIKGIVFL